MRRLTALAPIVILVSCGPGASTSECEALFDHVAELTRLHQVEEAMAEAKAVMSSEPGSPLADVDEVMRAELDRYNGIVESARDETVKFCKKQYTSKQVECMLRAKTVEELEGCPPEVDRRDPGEQPGQALCARAKIHARTVFGREIEGPLEEELQEARERRKKAEQRGESTDEVDAVIAKLEAEKPGKAEFADTMAAAVDRDCRLYSTREQVECQLEATSGVALLRCGANE